MPSLPSRIAHHCPRHWVWHSFSVSANSMSRGVKQVCDFIEALPVGNLAKRAAVEMANIDISAMGRARHVRLRYCRELPFEPLAPASPRVSDRARGISQRGGSNAFGSRSRISGTRSSRPELRVAQSMQCSAGAQQNRVWINVSENVYNVRKVYPVLATSQPLSKARRVFKEHDGMLRTSDALRRGIHPRTLYELRDRGEIERVGRGLYRLVSAPLLTSPDLVAIAHRVPHAVVCLISALSHHGLTTQIPHAIDLALPSHAQVPRIKDIPLRVFWYSEPSYSAGVEAVTVDRVPIRIYSSEKTIADCFKYRNKIGLDVAIEALRAYRERRRKPDLKALTNFAQINRVLQMMRPYLEATF